MNVAIDLEQRIKCQGKNLNNLRVYIEEGGQPHIVLAYIRMLEKQNKAMLQNLGDAMADVAVPFR